MKCHACLNIYPHFFVSCSQAIASGRPATCTLPNFEERIVSADEICPYPPAISVSEQQYSASEVLDSVNVYVDERLLIFGNDDRIKYASNIVVSMYT